MVASYPKFPRLAFSLSLKTEGDEAKSCLRAARDAALRVRSGLTAWTGMDNKIIKAEHISATLGRPAAAIDAVIEVSAPNEKDPAVLIDVAGQMGRIVSDIVKRDASDVVLGLSYSALAKGTSSHANVLTLCRDRRVDPEFLIRWWEIHHSRFNMYSPLGRKVYQEILSYELTNGTEALNKAAASAAGLRATRDVYESSFINNKEKFLADVAASHFGEPNVLDEDGFFAHEWRTGTPEEIAEARKTQRDTLYMAMVDILS